MKRQIKTLWIITNGNRGNIVNCEGIAAHLKAEQTKQILIERNLINALFSPHRLIDFLAQFHPDLQPPWPDMVIASSRLAVPYARYIRYASNEQSFCAFLQDPKSKLTDFHFVWAPQHDNLVGENVFSTLLSPHQITPTRLEQAGKDLAPSIAPTDKPRVAVIIGGPNSAYRFSTDQARVLANQLADLTRDYALMITLSRRTPHDVAEVLRRRLAYDAALFYEGLGPNPYPGILALSEAIIVTCDSVNMSGEACAAGKPVYIVPLPARRASKFEQFHHGLRADGLSRPFMGHIETGQQNARDDTQIIAERLLEHYQNHKP